MFQMIAFLIWTIMLYERKCSLVIDKASQNGIAISDYCPKMEHCEEGAHVMCMYYNPNRIMGPRCNQPKNVSITPELALKLLEVSNAVRSKIALGKEKGKGGEYLPRGYGVFRLVWDSELATFAQVLANQCVLRHDMCRATKKFPDPGQTAGLVRFTYPDWFPVSKYGQFTKAGLTESKVVYAITQTLKSWYGQKSSVYPHMITSYPDWALNPNKQGGRLYLEMIYGPATHMGCGISAYTEYAYYDNNAALNYNSVQVICNYSSRPRKGGSVYNTEPPTGEGFSARCGCPPGSDEDEDCLCSKTVIATPPPLRQKPCEDGNCDPAVVLLPIFTVEDAPPSKLIGRHRLENITMSPVVSDEIFNLNVFPKNNSRKKTDIHSVLSSIINSPSAKLDSIRNPMNQIVKSRHFRSNSMMSQSQYIAEAPRSSARHVQNKKSSIFSRSTIFGPVNRVASPFKPAFKDAIKIIPRKDFSNAKKLVDSYIDTKKSEHEKYFTRKNEHGKYNGFENRSNLGNNNYQNFRTTTETVLLNAEEKVISYNELHENLINKIDDHSYLGTKQSDKNLMALLDKLEQQVKHIKLRGVEKELFDAKIRKIYDTVLEQPDVILPNQSKGFETDYLENDMTDNFLEYDLEKQKIPNLKYPENTKSNKHNYTFDNKHYMNEKFGSRLDADTNTEYRLRPNRDRNTYSKPYDQENRGYVDTDKYTNNNNEAGYDKTHYERDNRKYSYENANKYSHRVYEGENINNERQIDRYTSRDTIRHKYGFDSVEKRKRYRYGDEYQNKANNDDDVLSYDRAKYYQKRLDNLERKLQSTRNRRLRNEPQSDRHLRPIKTPSGDNTLSRRPSKSPIDPPYMPDRARFLHGF